MLMQSRSWAPMPFWFATWTQNSVREGLFKFVRKPKRGNPKILCKFEKILRLESTNRFWKVCQIEKTISNPDLIHRSTYNFHENRKYFTIQESFQESFQNPENFRKSRKTFCHVTLAPVVGTLSRYSTLCHLVALGRLGVTTRTG